MRSNRLSNDGDSPIRGRPGTALFRGLPHSHRFFQKLIGDDRELDAGLRSDLLDGSQRLRRNPQALL